MDQFLTVTEVAEILKVKEMTVREMFRSGRLRGFKIGKSWRTTLAMLQEDLDKMRQSQLNTPDDLKRERQHGEGNAAPGRRRGRPPRDEVAPDTRPQTTDQVPPKEPQEQPVDDLQTYLF